MGFLYVLCRWSFIGQPTHAAIRSCRPYGQSDAKMGSSSELRKWIGVGFMLTWTPEVCELTGLCLQFWAMILTTFGVQVELIDSYKV